jgi:hypothetical protein
MRGDLNPAIELWVFGSPEGLQLPIFGSVGFTLTLSPKWGCDRGIVGIKGRMESTHWINNHNYFWIQQTKDLFATILHFGELVHPISTKFTYSKQNEVCTMSPYLKNQHVHTFIGMLVNLKHYIIDFFLVNMHTRFSTFNFNRTTNIVSIKTHCQILLGGKNT